MPTDKTWKRDDPVLEQAQQQGHLPGEEDYFFTEAKIKQYF